MLDENSIAKIIVDCAYKVHTKLGPGLLESVYQSALTYELRKNNLNFKEQVPININYDGIDLAIGFLADIIVEEKVIIELKSVESIHPVHKKQLLTYIRLADKRLGLLINFNEILIKNGITRIANNL